MQTCVRKGREVNSRGFRVGLTERQFPILHWPRVTTVWLCCALFAQVLMNSKRLYCANLPNGITEVSRGMPLARAQLPAAMLALLVLSCTQQWLPSSPFLPMLCASAGRAS